MHIISRCNILQTKPYKQNDINKTIQTKQNKTKKTNKTKLIKKHQTNKQANKNIQSNINLRNT